MIGNEVIQEAKGGFSQSFIEELAPVLSSLGERILAKVKKYTHSPLKWEVSFNRSSGFSFCEFETTDLSDIDVKGNIIIDWFGGTDAFIRVAMDTTGGMRPTDIRSKVYIKDSLDNIVSVLISMCRDANLTSER